MALSAACDWFQNNCWAACSDLMYVYIVIQQRNNMWRKHTKLSINRHNDINSRELFGWYCQPHVTDFKTIAELLVRSGMMYVYIVIQQRKNMWKNIPSCPLTHTMILIRENYSVWYCQPHVTDFKTMADVAC